MKVFRKILIVCLAAMAFTFILSSCKKDATADLTPQGITQNSTNGNNGTTSRSMEGDMGELDSLCFELVYPITVDLPDGTSQTANSNDELEAIFLDYYTANPNSDEDPMLQFPIEVIDENGEQLPLQDEEELYFMLDMCFDDWEECFTINYPVTVVFPDGTTQTVNDDEELEAAFDTWYENNPTSEEDPTLEFPIEVTDEEGNVVSVADEDALDDLFDECYGDEEEGEFDFCFDLVFPVTVELPNGTSQEANDYEELDEIIFTWFENNPTSDEFPTFAFPIQADLGDGEIVTVNNEEELETLLEECEDDEGDWGECFEFNYPITIVFPDGTTANVNSDDELETTVETWYDNNPTSQEEPTLQFPVDVTTADGEVLTINNEEELDGLLEECFECIVVNGDEMVTGTGQSAAAAMVVQQHAKVKAAKNDRVAKKFAKQK